MIAKTNKLAFDMLGHPPKATPSGRHSWCLAEMPAPLWSAPIEADKCDDKQLAETRAFEGWKP
jgi:hypothetical protein